MKKYLYAIAILCAASYETSFSQKVGSGYGGWGDPGYGSYPSGGYGGWGDPGYGSYPSMPFHRPGGCPEGPPCPKKKKKEVDR